MSLAIHFAPRDRLDTVVEDLAKNDRWRELGFVSAPTRAELDRRIFATGGLLLAVAVDESTQQKLAIAAAIFDDGPAHFEVVAIPAQLDESLEREISIAFVGMVFKRSGARRLFRYLSKDEVRDIEAHLDGGFERVASAEADLANEAILMIERRVFAEFWLNAS